MKNNNHKGKNHSNNCHVALQLLLLPKALINSAECKPLTSDAHNFLSNFLLGLYLYILRNNPENGTHNTLWGFFNTVLDLLPFVARQVVTSIF